MDFLVKIHKSTDGKRLAALCDKDLIGKKFEEGDLQLNISEMFYRGEEKSEKEVLELFRRPGNLNAVGEKAVEFCITNRLIEKSHVKKIKGIPFAYAALVG